MLSIREEINAIENGQADKKDNALKNAPHTQFTVISSDWTKSYSREEAAFPLEYVKLNKFWPSVSRVNNTHGDRHLICTCEPVSAYMEEEVKS
jgi:glycine dehydrogenase